MPDPIPSDNGNASRQRDPERNSGPDASLKSYALVSQLGLEMVGPIIIGIALDYWLVWTLPWLSLAGVGLGFVGMLTHLMLIASRTPGGSPGQPGSPKSP